MRRDAPSELASPSLTRASHARADENGGNSVKGSGFRTLQGFAQKDLGVDGSNEELGILGNSYYGSTTYFDDEISAALAGTANTAVSTGKGGDYSSAVDDTRQQVAKKITAYGAVWIYAIHEFEAAIGACTGASGDTYSAQHYWDEGWAFYAGSTQDVDSTSTGSLVYYLAEKRCENYATCASGTSGLSTVNKNVLQYSIDGLAALADCDTSAAGAATATAQLDLIKAQMRVPLIQGMLREAYKTSLSMGASADDIAEGWAFAYAILPQIDSCSTTASATILANMHPNLDSPMPDGFDAVLSAVEATFTCLGITCADVGTGLVDSYSSTGTSTWLFELCDDSVSAGSIAKQGLVVSVAVVSALGAMLMAL